MTTIEKRPHGTVERTWSHHAQVTLVPASRPPIGARLPGARRPVTLRLESITLHSTVLDGHVIRFVVSLTVSRVPYAGQAQEVLTYSDTDTGEYTHPLADLPPAAAEILDDEPTWLDRLTTTTRSPR